MMGNGCCNWGLLRRKKAHHGDRDALRTSFRKNMVLEERGDVYDVYDHVDTIGEGSISTITKIRKKTVGGSSSAARRRTSSREKSSHRGYHHHFDHLLWKKRRAQPQPAQDSIMGDSDASNANNASTSRSYYETGSEAFKKEAVFALKSIDLRLVNDEYLRELRNEIEILKTLDHPNIVKAYETFHHRKNISIVMELCTGGDLHSRHPYTEKEAAMIVGKVLSALSYMHKNKIMHRDIKFENILFENPRPDADIKLIDFGLSKTYLGKNFVMTERVGTVYTMSPQVIMGEYNYKADLWSLGVVTHMLLSGTKPFWGSKKKRIVEKIMKGRVSFRNSGWNFISKEAKDFVSCLLEKDPEKRPSAAKAQQHKWLSTEYKLCSRRPSERVMDRVNESILRYAEGGEFKKVALNVIAHKSTAEQIFQIRQAFDQYDRNNDGAISYSGFKAALSKNDYSEEELDAMFRSVDVNKNGVIFYTEFLAACLEMQGRIEEQRLSEAFDRLDADSTGYISKHNLRSILGRKCTEEYLQKLMAEVDTDRDGKISYDEFLMVFLQQKRTEIRDIYEEDPRTSPPTSPPTSTNGSRSSSEEEFADALEHLTTHTDEIRNGSAKSQSS